MILFALGFVLGAWCLQQQAHLPSTILLWLVCFVMLGFFLSFYRLFKAHFKRLTQALRQIFVFLFALALGFSWSASIAQYRLNQALPSAWERTNIRLVGVVASLPEINEKGERFIFDVERVLTKGVVVPSRIGLSYYTPFEYFKKNNSQAIDKNNKTSSRTDLPFGVGERWEVTVRLKRPHTTYNPHGFDFEAWALSENIRATGTIQSKNGFIKLNHLVLQPSYMIHYLRQAIGERINNALMNKSYVGVIRALVIGDDSQISQQDWQSYLLTGTNHLMSISGLHITMLAGLAYALMCIIWRHIPFLIYHVPMQKAASLFGMLIAIMYAALAGFSIPTQRTLYMLMTIALMLMLGKKLHFSQVLATALLVVLILDPWAVMATGFWLSFGAVAVIVYATNGRLAPAHWLMVATKTQWAVTLGLMPILIMLFGQFSIVSPLANAFAIPFISFAVVPPAILGSLFHLDILVQFSHLVLSWCMWGLTCLASLPNASWQQHTPPVWTMSLALLGIAWHLLPKGVPFRWMSLACLLPIFYVKPPLLPMGALKVTVLDVGQGLAIVLKTRHHHLLYDAGAQFSPQSDAGSRIVVPYLRGEGVSHLDGLIVSHDDLDHVGGVPSVLNAISVNWLMSSISQNATLFKTDIFQLHQPKQLIQCKSGQTWIWDGVIFQILSPSENQYKNARLKDNDKSCVLKVTSEYGSILLTGDAEKQAEYYMLSYYYDDLESDVLIAPHHGSKTSSTQAFVNAVNPYAVIFTNGYLNRFGHPKPVVLKRYEDNIADIYRTDYDGAVQILFNAPSNFNLLSWRKVEPKYWHDDYSK